MSCQAFGKNECATIERQPDTVRKPSQPSERLRPRKKRVHLLLGQTLALRTVRAEIGITTILGALFNICQISLPQTLRGPPIFSIEIFSVSSDSIHHGCSLASKSSV